VKGIFGFWWIKQYPNKQFNQISCHIGVKLSKNATTRNQLRRAIMNCVRDNNITTTPINGEFYKIFINLDKNKLPELTKYIEEHDKSQQNAYFQNEFKSAFTSLQSFLC
jgi:RNase P protein component